MENKFKITEGDIVSMKVEVPDGNIWPWFKVLFVDLDGRFVANLYKYPKSIGDDSYLHKDRWYNNNKISTVIKEDKIPGTNFCYSDLFTVCDCPGVCRNK